MTISSNPSRPAFIITMDAEGDNLWANSAQVTTENAKYLPRFQSLCERYGLKPTWLTNHEMVNCPAFAEFADDLLRRQAGEIGMHLHAWDSPPVFRGDPAGQAYLIEYPEQIMREKVARLTDCLEDRFDRKMVSHRAGRWALNSAYAHILVASGYLVDCSVTPLVSWTHYLGDPEGSGGSDYRSFPSHPYFMDLDHIDRSGDSPLLEVPMSIVRGRNQPCWLRPDGHNLEDMLGILRRCIGKHIGQSIDPGIDPGIDQGPSCVEFMLHSSELMPGGSPTFVTRDAIDLLYEDLEALFLVAQQSYRGVTLGEFRNEQRTTQTPGIW